MHFLETRNRKDILGVLVDDLSDDEMRARFEAWIAAPAFRSIVTPNPEFILLSQTNPAWQDMINRADLALADGVGLQFASVALTGQEIVHRQTGTDAISKLCEVIDARHGTVLMVGDREHGTYGVGALERARTILAAQFPHVLFETDDPGRLGDAYPESLAQRACDGHYLAVLVALPMPLQLDAIELHRRLGFTGVVMGVGGGLDMIAGTAPRAPHLWRNAGFEWLWRFMHEPQRYRRMYRALIVFPSKIVYATWQQGNLFPAVKRVFTYLITRNYVRH